MHKTFWQIFSNRFKYPTKRYVLIFNKWQDYVNDCLSVSEYDTLDEVKEEISLINKFYHDTPRPKFVTTKYSRYRKKRDVQFEENTFFWGFIVLDFEKCKCIEVGHDGICIGSKSNNINRVKNFSLANADYFFRKDDEIPQDYKWDDGEYEGWLQFRWGDGKNAIGYVEPEVQKKERPGVTEVREIYDPETDIFVKRRVRVVYVDWDEPLPKKEKGIIYERPNHEPIVFPGDFGYENDYCTQEWSLAEEIAGEEYLHKQGKNNFTVDNTTSSIGDMLGDDNPLLKLKFD